MAYEPTKTVHKFDTTGEAYVACQCDEEINDGEILLIESEGVVGLAGTWPVAVTKAASRLHSAKEGELGCFLWDQGMQNGLMEACRLATKLGFELVDEMKDD